MNTNEVDPCTLRPTIDVQDYFELRGWAKRFGVTAGDVRRAVKRVGDSPKDVESYLEFERLAAAARRPGSAPW
jgi:hypothetical protein